MFQQEKVDELLTAFQLGLLWGNIFPQSSHCLQAFRNLFKKLEELSRPLYAFVKGRHQDKKLGCMLLNLSESVITSYTAGLLLESVQVLKPYSLIRTKFNSVSHILNRSIFNASFSLFTIFSDSRWQKFTFYCFTTCGVVTVMAKTRRKKRLSETGVNETADSSLLHRGESVNTSFPD